MNRSKAHTFVGVSTNAGKQFNPHPDIEYFPLYQKALFMRSSQSHTTVTTSLTPIILISSASFKF